MIFISYSWQDRVSVDIIEIALRRMGLLYWIDRKYLDLRLSLQPQILRAIRHSSQILCIGSEASRRSPWVCYELKVASILGKGISEFDANHKSLMRNDTICTDELLASLLVCH